VKIPKSITKLIESFQSLPGIGPKSAQRLTFHLLHFPQEHLERFAGALTDLKAGTQLCETCKNVGEDTVCAVCSDYSRDASQIMVLASPLDAFAVERTGYKGLYHILHGVIDPLNSIGPEELFIDELLTRLDKWHADNSATIEVILATNTSMEGESTAMYISKLVRDRGYGADMVKFTRIARGIPVGGDIEYADEMTLGRAIEGRVDY
jgi:recombination protein RecR